MPAISPNLVDCLTCGSKKGWPCVTNTGARLVDRYHDARVDFAQK